MLQRYAIYFAPQVPSGAEWLGWDMHAGQAVVQPDLGIDLPAITKRPRKYGFHATIKAPIELQAGVTPAAFIKTAEDMAGQLSPVTLNGLTLSCIGRFLALTPLGDTGPLNTLAAAVVEKLDRFRAPLDGDTLARRRRQNLSASQEANLMRWGYPHVMDDFRFHMTLTGPLKDADRVQDAAKQHFDTMLGTPLVIDQLVVAGEDMDGMFHAVKRLPLAAH